MSNVFISYASADRPLAKRLAEVLSEHGWSIWWDRTIPPGRQFDEVIEAALDSSHCVVVLWSKASVNSSWVKTECSEAMRRKVLVPALIDDVRIPLEFRRIQAANLCGWQGEPSSAELVPLLNSIASLVARAATPLSGRQSSVGGDAPGSIGAPIPAAAGSILSAPWSDDPRVFNTLQGLPVAEAVSAPSKAGEVIHTTERGPVERASSDGRKQTLESKKETVDGKPTGCDTELPATDPGSRRLPPDRVRPVVDGEALVLERSNIGRGLGRGNVVLAASLGGLALMAIVISLFTGGAGRPDTTASVAQPAKPRTQSSPPQSPPVTSSIPAAPQPREMTRQPTHVAESPVVSGTDKIGGSVPVNEGSGKDFGLAGGSSANGVLSSRGILSKPIGKFLAELRRAPVDAETKTLIAELEQMQRQAEKLEREGVERAILAGDVRSPKDRDEYSKILARLVSIEQRSLEKRLQNIK